MQTPYNRRQLPTVWKPVIAAQLAQYDRQQPAIAAAENRDITARANQYCSPPPLLPLLGDKRKNIRFARHNIVHNHHPIHPMTLQLNSDCCSRCMSSSSSCCTFNQYDWTLAGSRHQKDNQPATTQQQQQPRNLIYFILKRHRHRRQPVVGGMGLDCLSSSPRESTCSGGMFSF